jgi:hypothetical protein
MGLGRPRTIKVREELPDLVDGIQWLAASVVGRSSEEGGSLPTRSRALSAMLDRHRVLHNVDGTPARDHRGSPASRRVAPSQRRRRPVGHSEPLRPVDVMTLLPVRRSGGNGRSPRTTLPKDAWRTPADQGGPGRESVL